ncbi:MAG: hypothetical protein A2083_00505 [Gemmatimonadetes bacterium GWC2_71_9]|nr:MAG: hypothetical protein A2083_00505 [Gemmatimonadetes bacterium GWC2_71_9]
MYQPDSSHQVVSFCCGPSLAVSPDGRYVAYEGAQSAAGVHAYVRERDQLMGRRLEGTLRARNLFVSPDGQWLGFTAGQTLRKAPVAGGAPVTIAELPVRLHGAAWTGDNTIVLAMPDSGGLFRVSADGGPLERLTTPDTAAGEAMHVLPHYVPEAGVVLYAVLGRDGSLGGARVGATWPRRRRSRIVSAGSQPSIVSGYLVTLRDGGILMAQRFDPSSGDTAGPAVRLADGIVTRGQGYGEFAASLEGTLVRTAVLNTRATLSLLRPDGTERSVPTAFATDQVQHFDNPRFSPDGRTVVIAGFHDRDSRHIGYLVEVERGATLRLTFDADTEFLEWTPDGRSVVFVRDRTAVAMRRADRSGEERTVVRLAGARIAGRLAVGRERVVFVRAGGSGGTDLWSAGLSGADSAQPYLATAFNEGMPALSPDGRWLAYVSDETGRSEVYVSAFPEEAGRVGVSVSGGTEPQWARDGRTLYFRSPEGDMVAARLAATGAGLAVQGRRVLFRTGNERSAEGAEYDVAPRGGFLMVGISGGGGGLVVTVNALR